MAQGAVKPKKASAAPAGRKAKPQPPKKGARVTKAKKASAADKMQKKFAAGMVAKTEKLLGERAGHLELIGKGRLKGADKEKAEGDKKKGGSRNWAIATTYEHAARGKKNFDVGEIANHLLSLRNLSTTQQTTLGPVEGMQSTRQAIHDSVDESNDTRS
ncbi:hypothetical protein F5B19DRAFT_493833 [Rostrohypoxylon terebratum]|nr:hypothetical protein F5B19DRAFT_493833 [Rostrohypoxylon terebratum]